MLSAPKSTINNVDNGSSVAATENSLQHQETSTDVTQLSQLSPVTTSSTNVTHDQTTKHAFTMRWIGLNLPAWLVLVMFTSKLVSYGSLRMIYSISPFLQEDWNVTNAEMGLIVASGEFGSLPAGFFIPFAELAGPRKSVSGMLLLVAICNALTAVDTSVVYLVVVRFLQSLCLTVFISCLQASAGCMVPPDQNLRLTTVLESGWGMSLLVVVPIIGVIYESAGWQAVYLVMGAVMLPVCAGLFVGLPDEFIALGKKDEGDTSKQDVLVDDNDNDADDISNIPTATVYASPTPMSSDTDLESKVQPSTKQQEQQQEQKQKQKVVAATGVIANAKAVMSVAAVRYNFTGALVSQVAINIMFALYSYWARDVHDKDVGETATYTLLIGVAELMGIVLLSQFGKGRWLGLYSTVIISLAVSGAVALLAGVLGGYTFEGGLAGYMLMFLAAEYSTVGGIALVREIAPAKALLPALGFYYQGMSIGRTIAALASPLFWEHYPELLWAGVWSASVFVLAIALQLRGKFLHEKRA